jgi:hypothetical protein
MVTTDRWQPAPPAMSLAAGAAPSPRLPDLADVRGIIARTLLHTKSLGRDDLTQTRAAAQAIMAVRPDLTLSQAMNGIARLQAAGAI